MGVQIAVVQVLVAIAAGYSVANDLLVYFESGTAVLQSQYVGSGQLRNVFNISFTTAFVNAPYLVPGILSYKNYCDTHLLIVANSVQAQITYCVVESILSIVSICPGQDQQLVINYFAADDDLQTNVEFYYDSAFFPGQYVTTIQVDVSTSGLDSPSTYKGCFLANVYCHSISLLPFTVRLTCEPANTTTLTLTYTTNSVGTYCAGALRISYYAVVIYPAPLLSINVSGTLISDPWNCPTIPIDPTKPSTYYFIGLVGFVSDTGSVDVRLKPSLTQMDSASDVVQAQYNYFQIVVGCQLTLVAYFPFENTVKFLFKGLQMFTTYTDPSFDDILTFLAFQFSPSVLTATMFSPAPDDPIQVKLKVSYPQVQLSTSLKLIVTDSVNVNVHNNSVDISIINIEEPATLENFQISDNRVVKNHVQPVGGNKLNLNLGYNKGVIGVLFNIIYTNTKEDIQASAQLSIPTISRVETSATSTLSSIQIGQIPYANSSTNNSFARKSPNILNDSYLPLNADGIIIATFDYLQSGLSLLLQFSYIPFASGFQVNLRVKLVTVRSMQTQSDSTKVRISFINIDNTAQVDVSEFSFTPPGPTIQSIQTSNDLTTIIADLSSYTLGSTFEVTYQPSERRYIAVTKDLKVMFAFKSIMASVTNSFSVTFKNMGGLSSLAQQQVSWNLPQLFLKNIEVTLDEIVFEFSYTSNVDAEYLSITYAPDSKIIYLETTTFSLHSEDSRLVYCEGADIFSERADAFWIVSLILDAVYLLTFLISLFTCNKMYGIELIYIIQLGYYSLIPININCPPFSGLQGLKYSTGYNPLFQNLRQAFISSNYASLGMDSNFLSNVNLMLLPLFVLSLFYFVLKYIAEKSTHYSMKPISLKYAKAFLCEVPLTILLFNSFNICVSFAVNLSAFKTSNLVSLMASIAAISLIPIAAGLFLKFQTHFSQFRQEFDVINHACSLSRETTIAIRKLYPMALIAEMSLIPLLLAIQPLLKVSLYIVLALQSAITVYVCAFPLYLLRSANMRNCIQRGIVLSICVLQILTMNLKSEGTPTSSLVYWHPAVLLLLISAGLLCTGMYIIFKSIEFWKAPHTIDNKLKIQQDNIRTKSAQKYPTDPEKWIVKHWYILKQLEKSRINQPSKLQTPECYLLPSQKIQRWFDEFGAKHLLQITGVDHGIYRDLVNNGADSQQKEKFIRQTLGQGIDFDSNLYYPSAQMINLEDYLKRLEPNKLKQIRQRNREVSANIKKDTDAKKSDLAT